MTITLDQLKHDETISIYIREADKALCEIGYTEHSFAHVCQVAATAKYILENTGRGEIECRLAEIAGYLHDIGNIVNRVDHSQSGAIIAFRILDKMGMPPDELAVVVPAIGNHDEGTGNPVNAVAAALILADKSDVRRSRVRKTDDADADRPTFTEHLAFDIHDRVNYSVKKSTLKISEDKTTVSLKLEIDTRYGSIMDYFEIFIGRMTMCRRAAEYLGLKFKLSVNGQWLL